MNTLSPMATLETTSTSTMPEYNKNDVDSNNTQRINRNAATRRARKKRNAQQNRRRMQTNAQEYTQNTISPSSVNNNEIDKKISILSSRATNKRNSINKSNLTQNLQEGDKKVNTHKQRKLTCPDNIENIKETVRKQSLRMQQQNIYRKNTNNYKNINIEENTKKTVNIPYIIGGVATTIVGLLTGALGVFSQFFATSTTTTTMITTINLALPMFANIILAVSSLISIGVGIYFIYTGATNNNK